MGDVEMTRAEMKALGELFADELARGWVPTRADLVDALHTLRAAHGDAAVVAR